jgi:acyl-[acyl-carrier-protein]-phospholipid O-acyltransferase/long-chain-fatty-acid--[acyl-carrier-protein] ligase
MKPELASAFKAKFGVDLYEGYGCTELSPIVAVGTAGYSALIGNQLGHKPGSVGHPIPGVAVRTIKTDSHEELGANREGMLLVKGPNIMMGYLGDAEKTRHVITEDGWYVTGDIAQVDEDGFITITDRLSRFSKIGGEMVPHIRVEVALQESLGIPEPKVLVTSLPDGQKGEKLIVLHTKLGITVEELVRRLRDAKLPKLWLPRKENFFEIAELPTLGSGKLDLKLLKETARRLAAAQSATTERS